MKENWYESWFDSDFYHILYKNRNDDEARFFLDNLIRELPMNTNGRAIDVGCGKGRHAIYLNSKGFDVQGIDLSNQSISCAKRFENEQLSFDVHDMRKPFKEAHFNYALNLFTSFGYFEEDQDNLNTILSISKGLKENGILVLDYLNTVKTIKDIPNEDKCHHIIDNIEFHTYKEIDHKYIKKNIEVRDGNATYHFNEKVEMLYLEDFERYLEKAGMRIKSIYGDYNLSDFNAETSNRLIIIASNSKT